MFKRQSSGVNLTSLKTEPKGRGPRAALRYALRLKSLGCCIGCLILTLLSSCRTTPQAGYPGGSSARLGSIDRVFAQWNRADSPGCAIAVVDNGKIVVERGYGMANLEFGVQINGETVFDLGSNSKQFTALAILLLAREGRLTLDD